MRYFCTCKNLEIYTLIKLEMKVLKVFIPGLCLLAGLVSCKEEMSHQPQASVYPLLTLTTENRTLSTTYSTVLEGKQYVEVRPQVSGFITDVLVKEGAKVRKGETLFIIDTIPYAATYEQAKAAVATAEAQEATSKLTLEGQEELYKENVISDFELQTSRNSYLTAKASLAQAKAQEVSAANNLSFAKVTSPVTGVAGMTSIRVGALVSSSMTEPLITVTDNSKMYAYFSLTEKETIRLIRQYGSLENTIKSFPEVSLTLSDGSAYGIKGRIDAISGIVENSVVRVRAIFDNPDGLLINGATANISIPYTRENCVVIPQEATFEVQDKIFAYKVVDGKATSTMITVYGINDGKEYIVESGLSEGDTIVATGAGLLREGTLVTAAPQTEAAADEKEGE